jgi:putative cell wall binding repeat protein
MPKRPINADVPAPEEQEAPAMPKSEPPTERREPTPRQAKSLAPKLLAGLAALAVLFIVVAIVGSSGGKDESASEGAAAPAPAAPESGSEAPASQTPEALGYPSFATNNTTRIGGSHPTAIAAAVALAVFPSATSSQQPSAVTLVSEEDWTGAIAASVLMAEPVRAPVLFSGGELPEATAEALAALDPQGDKATGGASVFAIGSVALPDDAGKVTRVDSGDPASTAAQIATLRDRLFGKPPKHILVVPTQYPEYAMPATAWAARSGDPILFTDTEKLPPPTISVLEQHPKTPVYVIGPSEVVSLRAIGEIGKLVKKVGRIPGPGPGDAALDLARNRYGSFGWGVNDPGHGFVLVRSDSPAEAAAAAPLSASGTWGPLLLTKDPDRLPAKVRSYLLDVKPGYTTDPTRAFYNHVWLIGDQKAIDVRQQAEVNELAELVKIGGEP